MRLQIKSCVYIVYLCREIVANYSRTSLQLSYSSEIGALISLLFFATIWRENKTKRHLYECRATLARMSRDCRTNLNEKCYIRGKVVRHSHECCATVVRQSRDCRATVARYVFKIRPKFANLSHKCLFNEITT